MQSILLSSVLSLVAGVAMPAFAQDPAPAPTPSAAALARLDELEAELDEFLQSWQQEQMERFQKFQDEVQQAEEDGKPAPPMPAFAMRPDFAVFVERLMGWAEKEGGEDAALYYTKVVELDGLVEGSTGRDALDRLVADHATSPSWARLGGMLRQFPPMLGEQRADEVLAVLRASPSGDVRGWVALADHAEAIESAELDSERYAQAKAALRAALERVGDEALRSEIEGAIELREVFGVGAIAPDIVGVDLDGAAFKLSDYKSKIVFLDFWGDW